MQPWACGNEGERCCNDTDCIGRELTCNPAHVKCEAKGPATSCGECCGEDDCPDGLWCSDDNECVVACGMEGAECCNGTDCIGRDLTCNPAHVKCEAKGPATSCGECCGEDDCPEGLWCSDDNECVVMCGMEGAECCNGTDCTGRELMCDTEADKPVCVPKDEGPACGEKGNQCCNGKDCTGNMLICDEDADVCVMCGGDWQPPCPGVLLLALPTHCAAACQWQCHLAPMHCSALGACAL